MTKMRDAESHLMTELLRYVFNMELAESKLHGIEATIREQVDHDMHGRATLGSRPDDLYRKAYRADEDWKVTLDDVRSCERRAAMLASAALAVQGHMRGMVEARNQQGRWVPGA